MWTPPNSTHAPPKTGEPPLHAAARTGDHDTIRRLVKDGADIEAVFDISLDPRASPQPATALMVAAGSGDGATLETVQLLIELGADPAQVSRHVSAATYASAGLGWNYRPGGDAERLRYLLDAGAPLPAEPEILNRMVCNTAESGDHRRLRVLLDAGAPAHGYFDSNAAAEQQRRMTDQLAAIRGSVPEIANMPADVLESMEAMNKEMAEEMASGPSDYEIPLFQAAMSGSAACVRLILDHGVDPLTRDNNDRTAMYCASSEDVVRALMDAGVPIDDEDDLGWSPLVHAVSDGPEGLPVLRALIACGADVNGTHDRGYTVFMSAVSAMERDPEILRVLVDAGADPHAVTELGHNAFHAAVDVNGEANEEASVRETLSYLKELGVDIERRNERGQTPLARAIEEGMGIEVLVLCELGADPNTVCPMLDCVGDECRHVEMSLLHGAVTGLGADKDMKVYALLTHGVDPFVTDADGVPPVSYAIAALCADADDYDAAHEAFIDELEDFSAGLDVTADGFLKSPESVFDGIRTFIERFAADIPIRQPDQFARERRQQTVNCLISLIACDVMGEE